jgi:hypothetical protein
MPGAADELMVQVRSVLLDALAALHDHRDCVVVIGAQAIYLHTGLAPVAVGRGDQGQRPRHRHPVALRRSPHRAGHDRGALLP